MRLPLLQDDPFPGSPINPCEPQQCLDEILLGVSILVVEDDADLREFISVALKQAGAAVTAVESVKAALQSLTETQPEIIISDIAVPDEDGYSLMEQIRLLEPELFRNVPAIALTAFASDADEHQTLAAGYQHHLSKPVTPEELIIAVAALVQS